LKDNLTFDNKKSKMNLTSEPFRKKEGYPANHDMVVSTNFFYDHEVEVAVELVAEKISQR